MDPDGSNLTLSRQWERLTGLKPQESGAADWLRLLHPEDAARARARIAESLLTGEPLDVQYRLLCATGDWRWIRARAQAQSDASGQIVRWFGELEDVEEQVRVRHALEVAQRALAQSDMAADRRRRPFGKADSHPTVLGL